MATAAAPPPHLFWVGKDRESVRGWPRGSSLLEMLGDINADVQDALADERDRLREHGYPADLPLPALWWSPTASAKDATERPLLAAVGAAV